MNNLTTKQYTQSDKLIISACVIAGFVVAYSFFHFKTAKINLTKNESAQINYEMAKLQTSEGLYSLENREIEKEFNALETKKTVLKAEQAKNSVTDKTKKVVVPQKATTPAAQKALNPAVAARNKALALKRFQDSQVKETQHDAKNEKSSKNVQSATTAQGEQVTEATPVKSEENKKSYEQWKAEVFAAQNKEAILKLVAAFKKGDVTADDFQKLVSEMLASKDDKIVGLGLYALRSAPSYASYVQLIKTQGSVNSSYSSYIQESLMSYNQNNGLSVLKQSLTSHDKVVVLKTLEIIKSAVDNIKTGSLSIMVDPRDRRNNSYSQFSLTNYLSFLPLLKSLASNSNDQDIITLANQNIAGIDDAQYVASNN